MRFTQSELELIGQCTTSDKILALTELRAVRRGTDDPLKKAIAENAIDKLLEVPEPECSRFIADTIIRFQEEENLSVRDRLAALKAQEPPMLGHDLYGQERHFPKTRHMIVLDILNSDSPVGVPGERYRFYLSDEGYKNAKASEARGEIKIRSHAAVCVGQRTYAPLPVLCALPGAFALSERDGERLSPNPLCAPRSMTPALRLSCSTEP